MKGGRWKWKKREDWKKRYPRNEGREECRAPYLPRAMRQDL